jgi:hypothetical protein
MQRHPPPRKPGEWQQISREFGRGYAARQLQDRWINFLRTPLNRAPFTIPERRAILKMACDHPKKWKSIAAKIGDGKCRSPAMVKNLLKNLVPKLSKHGFKVERPEDIDFLPDRFFSWGFPKGTEAYEMVREYNDKVQQGLVADRQRRVAGQFSIQALMASNA